jgi:ribose transport system permease protein
MAIGMAMIIITGQIDLSLGSSLVLCTGVTIMTYNASGGNVLLMILAALGSGLLCGLINGVMVGYAKMPAFIVTLATMLIFRSLVRYICYTVPTTISGGSNSLFKLLSANSQRMPFFNFGNSKFFEIPITGLFLIGLTMVIVYITTSTKFGKQLYAVGSNERAARLSGINVDNTRIAVFVITGILTGISAFLWVAMNASVDPATTGNSNEMYAIAAVVLGGISMSGGRGKCVGILFGVLSYTIIDKIIVALKMNTLIQDGVKGAILILVIIIQTMSPVIKEYFMTLKMRRAQKKIQG